MGTAFHRPIDGRVVAGAFMQNQIAPHPFDPSQAMIDFYLRCHTRTAGGRLREWLSGTRPSRKQAKYQIDCAVQGGIDRVVDSFFHGGDHPVGSTHHLPAEFFDAYAHQMAYLLGDLSETESLCFARVMAHELRERIRIGETIFSSRATIQFKDGLFFCTIHRPPTPEEMLANPIRWIPIATSL